MHLWSEVLKNIIVRGSYFSISMEKNCFVDRIFDFKMISSSLLIIHFIRTHSTPFLSQQRFGFTRDDLLEVTASLPIAQVVGIGDPENSIYHSKESLLILNIKLC